MVFPAITTVMVILLMGLGWAVTIYYLIMIQNGSELS